MPKFDAFKPMGKTNKEVLENLLEEASSICKKFDVIARRHREDIDRYRNQHRNTHGKHMDVWIRESTFKRLFEIAEPEKFSYDFHELRRSFLDSIDRGDTFNDGDVFVSICQISGIKPLYSSILSANQTLSLIYKGVNDRQTKPELDVFMFDMMELDTIILRIYNDANKFYGLNEFLIVLNG